MIIKSNPNEFGVYCITNIKNGKIYVGCTKRSFVKRYKEHCKRLNNGVTEFNLRHYTEEFLLDYSKFNKDDFVFESLYVCNDKNENLREKETQFIISLDSVKTGYNRNHKSSNELTYVYYDIYGNFVKEHISLKDSNLKNSCKRNRDNGNCGAFLYNSEFYVLSYDTKKQEIKRRIEVLTDPFEILVLVFNKNLDLVFKSPRRDKVLDFINTNIGYNILGRSATLSGAMVTKRLIGGEYLAILAKDLPCLIDTIKSKKQKTEKYKINKSNLFKLEELMI